MQLNEDSVAAVIGDFQNASLGAASWMTALERLAQLTGCMGGELIGLGGEAAVPFNLITGIAPEAAQEFRDIGGGDPRINSRVRVGSIVPELSVHDESDFQTAADMRRYPGYGEWIRRHDVPFVCLSPLLRGEGLLVGLAVIRNQRQGNIDSASRAAFAALAPHVRASVRTQMAIENQGSLLLTRALDAMSAAVFVCDRSGRVRLMSPRAEALVGGGEWLSVRNGALVTAQDADMPALRQALTRAVSRDLGVIAPPAPIAVHDVTGGQRLLVDVTPLSGVDSLRFDELALVIVNMPGENEGRAREAARALFGLAPAEASVAAQLALGRSVQAIAERNGVSQGTVRHQIKRIFEKADVHSQVELVSMLAKYV